VTRNPSHQKKSRAQLSEYNRAIRRQRMSPTVDDALDFRESSVPGEDLTAPVARKKRPRNVRAHLEEYFKEQWIAWIMGLACIVFVYFLVEAKVDFARLFSISDQHAEQLKEISQDIDKINDGNAQQNLKIQENRIRIDNLQRNQEQSDASTE